MNIIDWIFVTFGKRIGGSKDSKYEDHTDETRRYRVESGKAYVVGATFSSYFNNLADAEKYFWERCKFYSSKDMRKNRQIYGQTWSVTLWDQKEHNPILNKEGTYGFFYKGYK